MAFAIKMKIFALLYIFLLSTLGAEVIQFTNLNMDHTLQKRGVSVSIWDVSHFDGFHTVIFGCHKDDIKGDPTLHLIINKVKVARIALSKSINNKGIVWCEADVKKSYIIDSYITYRVVDKDDYKEVKILLKDIKIMDFKNILPPLK